MPQLYSHLLLHSLIAVVLYSSAPTEARCGNSGTSPNEQLPNSNFVFRLQYDTEGSATLPCPVRVWEAGAPSATTNTGFPQYTIVEIYKQDWEAMFDDLPQDWTPLLVGDSLSVIYSTDTGFQKLVTSNLRTDPNGFVAYLQPVRYCPSGDNNVYETITTSNLKANPFSLSECNRGNRPWADLTPQEQAYLKRQSQSLLTETENSFVIINNNNNNTLSNLTTLTMLEGEEEDELDPASQLFSSLEGEVEEDSSVGTSRSQETKEVSSARLSTGGGRGFVACMVLAMAGTTFL